jgi:Tfp pilus assembly protein PilF
MPFRRTARRVAALALMAAVAGGSVLSGGCADSGPPKPTEKELAQKRWAAARSSVLVSLAKDQYRTGNFEKARQTVDEALRLSPDNATAHLTSARLFVEKGQLEAGQRALDEARKLTPNDGEIYYLSGVILQRWQKHEAAHEQYQLAAKKSPAELAYLLAEAESLVTLDKADEALALLQEKAGYFEHSGTIRDAVGQLQMGKGQYAEAARSFRQASVLAEDEPSVKERLALALYKANQPRDAADVLARLLAADGYAKRADLFAILGECQLALGQPREARFSFETATGADPASAAAWRGLGRAALEAGDLKRAGLALDKSVKLDTGQSQTHLLLGYLAVQQGKLDAALKSFKAAASLDPTDTVAMCMVGYVYEKKRQPRLAAVWYGTALRLRPTDEMARKLMAGVDPAE